MALCWAVGLLVLLVVVPMVEQLSCVGGKRHPSKKDNFPVYEIHESSTLPSDRHVSVYLRPGESKSLFYESPQVLDEKIGALSVTLTSCSTLIQWSFQQQDKKEDNEGENRGYVNTTMLTHFMESPISGGYILRLRNGNKTATLVHIYVSTESGGPQSLKLAPAEKLRMQARQRRKRLTVKWNPSLVDPQVTTYCLIVSPLDFHGSLCSITKNSTTAEEVEDSATEVYCVGRKTHVTLPNFRERQKYFVNVFATNHQSNFTYPYASASTIYQNHPKPVILEDAVATSVNLKKLDGKAVFRFKIAQNSRVSALDLVVLPCGGMVDVEVSLRSSPIGVVIAPRRIVGFGRISVESPQPGGRYNIKIFATNREELRKTSRLEVFIYATTRNISSLPIPVLPKQMKIQEYPTLKTCTSVTVGYLVITAPSLSVYCLTIKEGQLREFEDVKITNQCNLENKLKKSADFGARYCRQAEYDKEQVVVQKISQLKPGRHYIVQVTVKKPHGKTLSYNLQQVSTKTKCSQRERKKRL